MMHKTAAGAPASGQPSLWVQFCADERGAELVEWVLVTVVVILGSIAVLTAIPVHLGRVFKSVLEGFMPTLVDVPTPTPPPKPF